MAHEHSLRVCRRPWAYPAHNGKRCTGYTCQGNEGTALLRGKGGMMKASLFKEFSNREEIVLIQAGKTVAENFPGVDFTNAIVLVNGKEAAPGQVVLEGDTVMIRTLPGVAATVTVLAIAFTAAVIAGGAYIYKMRKEMDAMEEEVEKMKKASGSDNITTVRSCAALPTHRQPTNFFRIFAGGIFSRLTFLPRHITA